MTDIPVLGQRAYSTEDIPKKHQPIPRILPTRTVCSGRHYDCTIMRKPAALVLNLSTGTVLYSLFLTILEKQLLKTPLNF